MQSGIAVSPELSQAFNDLVSTPSQRGLLVTIKDEKLVPGQSIAVDSQDFFSDLDVQVAPLLKDNEAAYVILRRYDETNGDANVSDAFVAVTYVPDAANVRQKMLFASTRLTLVRELGTERFRETLFATTKKELTAQGFMEHDAHGELKAPLTAEEETLQGIKDAEAEHSRGTSSRSSHVNSRIKMPVNDDALQALKDLESSSDNLVQLRIDVSKEIIELAGTSTATVHQLPSAISTSEPRYSYFRYQHDFEGKQESPVVFIYTCPGESKIKERMVYASSRRMVVTLGADVAGLNITKKFEASDPSEITPTMINDELHPKQERTSGFARPKRPGR